MSGGWLERSEGLIRLGRISRTVGLKERLEMTPVPVGAREAVQGHHVLVEIVERLIAVKVLIEPVDRARTGQCLRLAEQQERKNEAMMRKIAKETNVLFLIEIPSIVYPNEQLKHIATHRLIKRSVGVLQIERYHVVVEMLDPSAVIREQLF